MSSGLVRFCWVSDNDASALKPWLISESSSDEEWCQYCFLMAWEIGVQSQVESYQRCRKCDYFLWWLVSKFPYINCHQLLWWIFYVSCFFWGVGLKKNSTLCSGNTSHILKCQLCVARKLGQVTIFVFRYDHL